MMTDFLTYDLKVAVLITVFYMFYRLLLARETFHRVNRVVLLLTAVASFVLPLCVITTHRTVVVEAMPQVTIGELWIEAEAAEEPDTPSYWQTLLLVIYIVGVAAMLGHMLLSIQKVLLLIRRSERHRQPDGTTICVTGNAGVAPFSWMRYIVMNRGDYAAQDAAIIAHERGHIRLGHSWDVLLVDLLTALQWFNPTMWMLRQDLRSIHEYEADGEVLSQGINARQYQYLLISKATGIGGYSIVNGINHSTLKKRIHMMTNRKSKGSHLLKLLAIVPIVGTALALNARTVTDYVYDEPQKQQPVKKGKKDGAATVAGKTIQVKTDAQQATVVTVSATVLDMTAVNSGADATDVYAVPGALVKIVGSTKGTVTDREGRFSLEANVGDKIEVSYVGMETATTEVKPQGMTNFYIGLRKEGQGGSAGVSEKVYDVVDEMPQFPGGTSELMKFLSRNIRYPKEAEDKGEQGRVIVTFVIEKDGNISDTKVMKSVSPQLDAEALRVINAMPAWTPGKRQGELVSVKYTLPVTFRLQGDNGRVISIGELNSEDKQIKSVSYMTKRDGQPVEEATIKDDFDVEIDGVKSDKPMQEALKDLKSEDIESMYVLKSAVPKPVVIITTKKKQKQ